MEYIDVFSFNDDLARVWADGMFSGLEIIKWHP